jgi:hypothetical protein
MTDQTDPTLTFRIALDVLDKDVADEIARRLTAQGLKVDNVTGRGLLASGARSLIERALRTRIDLGKETAQFAVEPQLDGLKNDTGYRIYFPRGPTYF